MRPAVLSPLFASVQSLSGVGPRLTTLLAKALRLPSGVREPRVVDLLWHAPTGVIDRRAEPLVAGAVPGTIATFAVRVLKHRPAPRGNARAPYKVLCEDDSGRIALVFFHAERKFIERQLPVGVLLEGVIAFVFMERHWQAVTRRLSEATARDIGAVIDIYQNSPRDDDLQRLVDMARDRLNLSLQPLPPGELPVAQPRPFFSLLDRTLSNEIRKQIKYPFWVDTVGDSRHVEIKVKLDNAILRFVATRSQTYASNSHLFLMWMIGTSIVLLSVAILFMGNQIRPILRLAEAVAEFGKGRPVPDDFRPRGAREVRQAAHAFLEMRDRIRQHVEQRTTMLAGVSHDLRTVLTRFKLQLALLGDKPGVRALDADVIEMQHMLEDYLAFARGDGGEEARPTHLRELLEEVHAEAQVLGASVELKLRRRGELVLPLKRQAFKRAVTNLVSNAVRFGDRVVIRAATEREWLRVEVDDDGPGIPEAERDNVFRPFYRLDHARNQDTGNTGLGLAIARDIARSHGGDIALGTSSLGGLRAIITVPL